MTSDKTNELRKLAVAVEEKIKGEWVVWSEEGTDRNGYERFSLCAVDPVDRLSDRLHTCIANVHPFKNQDDSELVAQFMASSNPKAVIELLDYIDMLEKKV